MTVTRTYKVYGREGHRQKESFNPSTTYDWSGEQLGTRILEILNADKTGTNEYTIVRITRNNSEECDRELEGQITDGLFENCGVGRVEEIVTNLYSAKDINDTLANIKTLSREAKAIAEYALRKQLPLEPTIVTDDEREKRHWVCRSCGAHHHSNVRSHYCSYCGARVDWKPLLVKHKSMGRTVPDSLLIKAENVFPELMDGEIKKGEK